MRWFFARQQLDLVSSALCPCVNHIDYFFRSRISSPCVYFLLSIDYRLEKSHFEIQLGMLRRFSYSPLEQTRPVLSVYVHSGYNPRTLENDIALVRVQEPFQLNQWTAPACLPSLGYSPRNDTLCTVVGWGNVQENGPECMACPIFSL